jgi:two-component system response regulator
MTHEETEILLVEDNVEDAEQITRALKEHYPTINVVHVKDGDEALEFIFCQNRFQFRDILNQPKLVLLDLMMPKVSGIHVLEKIKSDYRSNTIPVIILTSSKEDPNIEQCFNLGANSYIVKPTDYIGFLKAFEDLDIY